MSVRLVPVVALFAGCLAVVGCTRNAKLEASKNFDLTSESPAQAMILDPQPKPQKLTISFKSSEGDVNVLVFKDADIPKGDEGLMQAAAAKALAQKKGKAESFTVDVPENTGTQIVVREPTSKKSTKVEVTVSNKK